LPRAVGRVHPTFRTPDVAVVVCSLTTLGLGLAGTFTGAATLSATARLIVYVVICAAVVALRRRSGSPAGFVLPAGATFAVLGVAFSAWLLSTRSLSQGWSVALIVAAGVALRWGTRQHRVAPAAGPVT